MNDIRYEEFDNEVNASTPVVVDLYSRFCGPCLAFMPALNSLETKYKGQVKFVKMDVLDNAQIAARFGVKSVPTFLIFKGGEVVNTITGASKTELEEAINKRRICKWKIWKTCFQRTLIHSKKMERKLPVSWGQTM